MSVKCATKINHGSQFTEAIKAMYDQSIDTDVTFLVENQIFRAHRALLSVQSPVFAAMLLGDSFLEARNPRQTIRLPGKQQAVFDIFLRYFYGGALDLPNLDLTTVCNVAMIADEYQVSDLLSSLCQVLEEIVALDNVCELYETALRLREDNSLLKTCRNILCENAEEVLKNCKLLGLSEMTLKDIISQDTFYADELDVLIAVYKWYEHNGNSRCGPQDVLRHVRFHNVDLDTLMLNEHASLRTFLEQNELDFVTASKQPCKPRKASFEESKLLLREATVEGLSEASARQFFRQQKTHKKVAELMQEASIVVYFPKMYISATSMSFEIFGSASTNQLEDSTVKVAYTVETSMDKLLWQSLADCSLTWHTGKQLLIFCPRNFRFVKITGKPIYPATYGITGFACPAFVSPDTLARHIADCKDNTEGRLYRSSSFLMKLFHWYLYPKIFLPTSYLHDYGNTETPVSVVMTRINGNLTACGFFGTLLAMACLASTFPQLFGYFFGCCFGMSVISKLLSGRNK